MRWRAGSGDDARRFDEIVALADQAARTGDPATIDRVVSLLRQVEDPHHPRWTGVLFLISSALQKRFEGSGDVRALDGAIAARRQVVAVTPRDHPRLG